MSKQQVHVIVFKDAESDQYVVECLEYGVTTQGDTIQDALTMIKEAVELHLEDRTEDDLDLFQPIDGEPELHTITIDAPSLLRR